MYLVRSIGDATAPDIPGNNVQWTPGQTRYVHESLIQSYRNNPAAWEIVATPDASPVTSSRNPLTGGVELSGVSAEPFAAPRILIVGDSTVLYALATTGAPTAAVGNADGTVTVQFSSAQGFHIGDRIGCSEVSNTMKFCATDSVVLNVTGSGPYFYTFTPDQAPTVGAHPSPGNIAIVYPDRQSSAGFATEFNALLGAGFYTIVAGNGGDDIYDIKSRLPSLVRRFTPTHVILSHGINDCYRTSRTVSEVIGQYKDINTIVSSAGAVLEVVGPPPQPSTRSSWTTVNRDWMRDFRYEQYKWCNSAKIAYTDWYQCAYGSVQAVDPTSANAVPGANVIGLDLVHPALAGNYLVGKALAAKYKTRYPLVSSRLARSVTDSGVFPNPLMTGTGGTRTNGTGTVAAGNVANNMDVTVLAGTATVTPYQTARTIAADGDLCGNWQGASLAAVAAGDAAAIRTATLHSLLENGRSYRLTCAIRLKSGASLCKSLSLSVTSQTATTGNKVFHFRSTTSQSESPHPQADIFIADVVVGVRGPQSTHGSPSSFIANVVCVAAAAGTIEFEVATLSMIPL